MIKWKNIPEDIEKYLGFVYKITNLKNGKFYIGQKKYFKIDKKKVKILGMRPLVFGLVAVGLVIGTIVTVNYIKKGKKVA